jgi:dienelactone hydrolase
MAAKNMIGAYGPWAASLLGKGPAGLSFRQPRFKSVAEWKPHAMAKVQELVAEPEAEWRPRVRVERQFVYDGLHIEQLSWQLPYGPRTEAVFLKPAGARGKLPGVLALHDHGGRKYFGLRKITRVADEQHPLMQEHQERSYGGVAWANEMARRGYAVLVHDAFTFASRRVRYADVTEALVGDRADRDTESADEIAAYNAWSAGHEAIMAKSLFCAGTTWPGVYLHEDRWALDYLCTRRDVDSTRLACGGLSGGGLRTVMLAGLDPRIRAAFPVGFMSTWRDFLLNKCFTHTWMLYIPLLPEFLDFPEILGLRVPLPTFVLNDTEDSLYTVAGMREADRILRQVYRKAGAAKNYRCQFYPGGHKFDLAMQRDAFEWLARVFAK